MRVITFAGPGGGVDQAILAINIAVEASHRDLRVLLVDVDRAGVIANWRDRRLYPAGPNVQVARLSTLPFLVEPNGKSNHELLVIHVSGESAAALFGLFKMSDLLVIPTVPSLIGMPDILALRRTAEAAGCQHVTVLTRSARIDSKRNRTLIEKDPGPVAPVILRGLVANFDSYVLAKGVVETSPKSLAAREVRHLLDHFLICLEGETRAKSS